MHNSRIQCTVHNAQCTIIEGFSRIQCTVHNAQCTIIEGFW